MVMNKVPVLTYHSNNITGNDYHNNDHIALQADLVLIEQLGFKIISLDQLIDWHGGQLSDTSVDKAVVITFDDGSWFDYYDMQHPTMGLQKSFYNILKDHQDNTGQKMTASSFVIVSPQARDELDKGSLIGKGWWTDQWWLKTQKDRVLTIENHSWDHNHHTLSATRIKDQSFSSINDFSTCERQVYQSQKYLGQLLKPETAKYFAFPYGDFSDYLVFDYLPNNATRLSLKAAFTTEPKYVTKQSNIWQMPRFVCGAHWQDKVGLKEILLQ